MSWTTHLLTAARSAIDARRARIAVVVALELAYGGLFPLLHGFMGEAVGVFAIPPVLLAGVLLGSAPGMALGLVNAAINAALFVYTEGAGASTPTFAMRHLVPGTIFVLFGWGAGALSAQIRKREQVQRQLEASLAREREANLALREREAQLAMAQEVAQLGAWTADFTTGRERWSPELCRVFGLEPRRAGEPGGLWFDLVHLDDRQEVADAMVAAVTERRAIQVELRLVRGDGAIRHAVGRLLPVADEQGRIARIVVAVQDVTEFKQIQEQLAAADRSASLGALVSRVAHEINNPLACVVSNVHFALKELDEPASDDTWTAEMRDALGEALSGAERVRKSVQDLRALVQPAATGELDAPRAERQPLRAPAPGEQAPAASE
jgi:PAS domain S-box-containing protein